MAAGAVDREFVYIEPPRSLPGLLQTFPEAPRASPDLQSLPGLPELSHDVFVDFLRDVRNRIIGFETTFEGSLSKSCLKTYGVVRDIPKQVKRKHCTAAPQDCQMQLFMSNLQILEHTQLARLARQSGGIDCSSDPTFHTRWEPG